MGVHFSCPMAVYFVAENILQSLLLSFFCSYEKHSFVLDYSGAGKYRMGRTVNNAAKAIGKNPMSVCPREENSFSSKCSSADAQVTDSNKGDHNTVVKQKVYRSIRSRRKLGDCAVSLEQNWWRLLDFAQLKQSSISFFDVEKHESAVSKWSRAGTRAAKVGKGLSKNEKAQKLAFQHWLEAIDPQHRYGHNLNFYYVQWLESKSREPFFYWLDIGEGKEANHEMCSRSKLQQQIIKYLAPAERQDYEIVLENGRFIFKQSRRPLHTTEDAKWIFVLSTSHTLYVGMKKKGEFQHSSFLAGGVTLAAGRIAAEFGVLKAVWPHSGHYHPTKENFDEFLLFLRDNNVDLANIKTSPKDDDEHSIGSHHRSNSSEDELIQTFTQSMKEEIHEAELVNTMKRSNFYQQQRPSLSARSADCSRTADLALMSCNLWKQSFMLTDPAR